MRPPGYMRSLCALACAHRRAVGLFEFCYTAVHVSCRAAQCGVSRFSFVLVLVVLLSLVGK